MVKTFKYVNHLHLKINLLEQLHYSLKISLKLEWKGKDLFTSLMLK